MWVVSARPLVDTDLLSEVKGTETCAPSVRVMALNILPVSVTLLRKLATSVATKQQMAQMNGRQRPDAKGSRDSLRTVV